MYATKNVLLATTAAVALLASPTGFVGVSFGQGQSGESAGVAGDMGGGHGVAAGAQSGDRGVSGQAMGRGHGGFGDGGDSDAASDDSATASSMGSLNASNASPTARSSASTASVVGQLGAYETQVAAGEFASAGEVLASAANRPITADILAEVNARLGLELADDEFDAILGAATAD